MPCCAPAAASPTAKPDWALSAAGLAGLRGRGGQGDREEEGRATGRREATTPRDDERGPARRIATTPFGIIETDPQLAAAFAAVDAANARAERTLAGETPARRPERDPLVYDPDWDEDGRLDDWRAVVDQTRSLPPTLAAAIAADAWDAIEPLQHTPWLGRLLAASAAARPRQNPLASAVPPCRAESHPA